jgi:coenzyme F420-reducing hydrogenase beta subunit
LSDGEPVIYAANNKNTQIRKNSTSGGVFSALAAQMLEEGGTVYGATYGQNLYVQHERADTEQECQKFCFSKYVQSDTGNTFSQAESDLKYGRSVLYSGTPCQIASFKTYLRKEYGKLYTVEVVCHGVPSAKMWREFLDLAEKKTGHTITAANFRDKTYGGWHNAKFKLLYDDGKEHFFFGEQAFFQLFNSNLSLRPSCLRCPFIRYYRPADISIADYWGIEKLKASLDDNIGTSMVLVNTEQGRKLFDCIQECLDLVPSNKEHCWQGRLNNRNYVNPKTEQFREEYLQKGMKYVMNKYTDFSFGRTFVRKVKRKLMRDIFKKEDRR